MAKKRRSIYTPFQLIDGAALAWVVGGRITPRTGLDPAIVSGITNLAKTIGETGQLMQANEQKRMGELQQVMQQVKAQRGG